MNQANLPPNNVGYKYIILSLNKVDVYARFIHSDGHSSAFFFKYSPLKFQQLFSNNIT